MERNGDCLEGDKSHPAMPISGETPAVDTTFFLDQVGEVILTFNSDGLSWNPIKSIYNEPEESSCLGIKLESKNETAIKFSDVYAVEFIDWGLVNECILANAGRCLSRNTSEMYRFTVHGVHRSKSRPSVWAPSVYAFGHKDLNTCQIWVNMISASLNTQKGRPKSLLVFVHPKSGKGNGCRTWEAVAPIFFHAKVKTKVIVTQRAGHAFDMMSSITNRELNSYDGVVAVGGDGFFNEILNGLISSRLKAPYPPAPHDFMHNIASGGSPKVHDANETVAEPSDQSEAHSPLLPGSRIDESRSTSFNTCQNGTEDNSDNTDKGPVFSLPNEWFRLGIIPSGSTDAIVMCTTGTRDPITSALHIVLGKRVCLDIVQVVRWKLVSTSEDEPSVRYAASFAGYGFYGDVITESEKYRWMGPKRYDYAGTMVFLRHSSYEAEIAYIETKPEGIHSASEKSVQNSRKRALWGLPKRSERVACRANCNVCNSKAMHPMPAQHREDSKWVKSKGRFLSIGAAVISCRNERAPDGLVADAHLSDGLLDLILIRDCPRRLYLQHLLQLARRGGNPLDFEFVKHHKTPAFVFTSSGNQESVWNVDGELFQAHQLSAQVFRGLISLFATGPEV